MKKFLSLLVLSLLVLIGVQVATATISNPPATTSAVTSITAGTGLTGGVITTSGTVALDLTATNSWTGGQTFVNATSTGTLTVPYSATLTTPVSGNIGIDSTSGQLRGTNGTTKVFSNGNTYPAFTYATSTAWTATTTIPLGTARVGETWNDVQCFTDIGTLNVDFYHTSTHMNMLLGASTTVGTVGLSTNNTITTGEKRYVDIGTPATAPTKISCTVSKSITAD